MDQERGFFYGETGGSTSSILKIYKYDNQNSNWIESGSVNLGISLKEQDRFTKSIAINEDGTIVAVVSSFDLNQNGVFIYEYDGANWNQKGSTLESSYKNTIDLNSNGNIIAVGYRDNLNYTSGDNYVKTYIFRNNDWVQFGNTLTHSNDGVGYNVVLDDSGLVMATSYPEDGELDTTSYQTDQWNENGSVKVFKYNSSSKLWTSWGQSLQGANFNILGSSISLSGNGNILAVAELRANSDAGRISVYNISNYTRQRIGQVVSGSSTARFLGFRTELNGNGDVLAVSSALDDRVRVFEKTINQYTHAVSWQQKWEQQTTGIGQTIAVSKDTKRLAIYNSENTGSVNIYNISAYSPVTNDISATIDVN